MLAAKNRAQKAAEKKIADEEKAVVKAEKAAERAAVKAEKEAAAAARFGLAAGGRRKAGADLARVEAELEKEVELEDELTQMESRGGGDDAGQAEALDRLGSDLSDLEDEL
jgi:hypothetical protein